MEKFRKTYIIAEYADSKDAVASLELKNTAQKLELDPTALELLEVVGAVLKWVLAQVRANINTNTSSACSKKVEKESVEMVQGTVMACKL